MVSAIVMYDHYIYTIHALTSYSHVSDATVSMMSNTMMREFNDNGSPT